MNIKIPELALVALIGGTSSGKTSFARRHFLPTETISSDQCRALVSDDENNMDATADAFDALFFLAKKRLDRGLFTVLDATHLRKEDRANVVALAREQHLFACAVVLDLPVSVLKSRHAERSDRPFSEKIVAAQAQQMRHLTEKKLQKEGFRYVFFLKNEADVAAATVARERLWTNKKDEIGPFDIIGDVHGCFEELCELLEKLGWAVNRADFLARPPENDLFRKAIFVGDLVDRGPDSPSVLKLVLSMCAEKVAFCIPGNHDSKLVRALNGANVEVKHGLAETLEQLDREPPEFKKTVADFLDRLVSHLVFDGGRLVVAHAGIQEKMQNRTSRTVREFCLFGETTGEIDEFGLPIRLNWALDYRGKALVAYGHTPVPEAEFLNNTVDLDTGCVFGGKLTAMRYPERKLVSVAAKRVYSEPKRPIGYGFLNAGASNFSAQQLSDHLLNVADFSGKRTVLTRFSEKPLTIRAENSVAALETMSRFAANPKWLIYLPPTMSPVETSPLDGFLERPEEAFDFFEKQGATEVVCEEKHMGSRAVVIVCRENTVAQSRFGLFEPAAGVVLTRTGRRFFNEKNAETEVAFLEKLRSAMTKTGFWDEQKTDWAAFDAELLPWSAKAQELIKKQYAAVGSAGKAASAAAVFWLEKAKTRRIEGVSGLFDRFSMKKAAIEKFTSAYQKYCRPTDGIDGLSLAPFHLLAVEGRVFDDETHLFHLETLAKICRADPDFLIETRFKKVDLNDIVSKKAATDWWVEMTERGGEGMVVKPLFFVQKSSDGRPMQPAVKVRGAEYLRIIYGPDYDAAENLSRLKTRGLNQKRQMASKEFALGLEGLHRFVEREPLRRVHECVFGVLALESDWVDPRL